MRSHPDRSFLSEALCTPRLARLRFRPWKYLCITICFTPNSFICWQSSRAERLLTFSQPSTATIPFLASTPATMRSAPKVSTSSFINSGRSTARVPMMQRVMPRSSIFFTASALRIPPPSSIGTETLDAMARMASSFTECPASAPSRSTMWRKDAPG